jgi:hypothetical protein
MKTIYKYGPVTTDYDDCVVHGRIVHVGMQGDDIFVWAELDENIPTYKVKYVATGQDYDGEYVGTVIERGNSLTFVWHVIQEVK